MRKGRVSATHPPPERDSPRTSHRHPPIGDDLTARTPFDFGSQQGMLFVDQLQQ